MWPVLFDFNGFHLATYGLLVACAYLLSILWLKTRVRDLDVTENEFWGLVYAVFVGAILGSKALYMGLNWEHFVSGEMRWLADFRYGFVFWGGVLGGAGALWVWALRNGKSFLRIADLLAAALPLGHGVGRLACLAAGCCYGRPTDVSWGLRFHNPGSLVPVEFLGIPLHPVQLYEAVGNLLIAVFLIRFLGISKKRGFRRGTTLFLYMMLYGAARFVFEMFRGDDRGAFVIGASPSQWISLLSMAIAGIFLTRHILCPKQ